MRRTTDHILTMHAGSLPRPNDVRAMVLAKGGGEAVDEELLATRLQEAVTGVVQMQIECGVDSINDGEQSKTNFSNYVKERLGGTIIRTYPEGEGPLPQQISGRDRQEFPYYFSSGRSQGGTRPRNKQTFCVEPLTYVGQDQLAADMARFKNALTGVTEQEPFLPAVAPGSVEHWLWNEHYATQEEFVFAIADVMRQEYKAIADAGFVLQIDDPDMFDAFQIHPEFDVPAYRKFAQLRIEALNYALRDIPREQVRLHVCWGSYHGPHLYDIPLKDVIDLYLTVNASAYSLEASNPAHDHEWVEWKNVKLPDGATLIPGVVGHSSDFIEHPELVAQRLMRYADIVGKENLMAGTDCGLGTRVGDPAIAWAKFRSMSQGAAIASAKLWG